MNTDPEALPGALPGRGASAFGPAGRGPARRRAHPGQERPAFPRPRRSPRLPLHAARAADLRLARRHPQVQLHPVRPQRQGHHRRHPPFPLHVRADHGGAQPGPPGTGQGGQGRQDPRPGDVHQGRLPYHLGLGRGGRRLRPQGLRHRQGPAPGRLGGRRLHRPDRRGLDPAHELLQAADLGHLGPVRHDLPGPDPGLPGQADGRLGEGLQPQGVQDGRRQCLRQRPDPEDLRRAPGAGGHPARGHRRGHQDGRAPGDGLQHHHQDDVRRQAGQARGHRQVPGLDGRQLVRQALRPGPYGLLPEDGQDDRQVHGRPDPQEARQPRAPADRATSGTSTRSTARTRPSSRSSTSTIRPSRSGRSTSSSTARTWRPSSSSSTSPASPSRRNTRTRT